MLGSVNVMVMGAEDKGVLVIGAEDEEEAGDEAIVTGSKEFSFRGSDTIKYFKERRETEYVQQKNASIFNEYFLRDTYSL
jgi:hypothetical protein